DAEKDFMRSNVVLCQIVRVVRDYQRDSGFGGQPVDLRQQDLVLIEPVILQLQEEVVFSEKVGIFVGKPLGIVVLVREQGFVDIASQAGGHGDQSFGMLSQQVFVDPRFVVEPFEITG